MFGFPPPLAPGNAAPPFSLLAHDGRPIKLVEFRARRRVVVAFYAQDDSPGSTRELQAFEARRADFEALQAQLLAVGPDSLASHARYAARLGLGFPLLSDPGGQVARAYGVRGWWPLFARKTFVVDGRGVLQLVNSGAPDLELLLTFLDGLRGDLRGS